MKYDVCVITAANEYQAQGYREQLRWRMDRGALPAETQFLVVPDPKGKRIGSGGSTIYVLYRLLEHLYCPMPGIQPFRGKRVLILHSGGDSKRLPAYSAVGKIFIPLPASRGAACIGNGYMDGYITMFDILLGNLMQLPRLDDGQVVVASGDVLLSFDASEVAFSDSGVTGVAYPGPVEVASEHGVYVVPRNISVNNHETARSAVPVSDFLQKPSRKELVECDGLDFAGRAFIDTGVMNFSLDAVETIMTAAGVSLRDGKVAVEKDSLCENLINASAELDIYREFPFGMLGKSEAIDPLTHGLIDSLTHVPFSVSLLSYCEFFHIGTSRHLIQNFHTVNHTASIYGFQNFSRTKVTDRSELENAFVYNSVVDSASVSVGGLSLIEGCRLDGEVHLGGENILASIPEGVGNIDLMRGICAACIPVNIAESVSPPVGNVAQKGWVSIVYGVEDSFKEAAGDNGATFLNRPFVRWMEEKGISTVDLWSDSEPHDLWSARLFPFSGDPGESLRLALSLQTSGSLPDFQRSQRMSLREIIQSVDYGRLLDNSSDLCREINLSSLATVLTPESDLSSREVLSWCQGSGDYTRVAKIMLDMIERSHDLLFQARLYKLLSSILREAQDAGYSMDSSGIRHPMSSMEYEDKAFELIREAIANGLNAESSIQYPESRVRIRSDEVVWVCAPARLDFAGGWTDTPPYCLERGGSVLNAAVKLNGQYPIQVIGKLHPEPFIRINSIDLGERVIVSKNPEILSYQDPGDWSSLPKAAFAAAGIVPVDSDFDLQDIIKQLGSGIDLTLFSAVPAGSGLGTSSILGSAVIACLSRMTGRELTQEELFNRTLYMEQLMTTGGGWQDQVGGVVGGVKHIETEPGLFQIPCISWTDLRSTYDVDLSERFLLYYTGYRRMAKNILRNVVGRYLDRDSTTLETLAGLREKSLEMKEDLDHRDIDAFGKRIADAWKLNKTLDPGTSNENIEVILGRISHLIYGAKLLGAGGGGFLFIVSRGFEQTRRIREIFMEEPPNDRARFFDFDVDQGGLRIHVL